MGIGHPGFHWNVQVLDVNSSVTIKLDGICTYRRYKRRNGVLTTLSMDKGFN